MRSGTGAKRWAGVNAAAGAGQGTDDPGALGVHVRAAVLVLVLLHHVPPTVIANKKDSDDQYPNYFTRPGPRGRDC